MAEAAHLAIGDLARLTDANQSCGAVDRIARAHLAQIDCKTADLTALRFELDRVIRSCRHATVADCKIIETLARRVTPSGSHNSRRAGRVFARREWPSTRDGQLLMTKLALFGVMLVLATTNRFRLTPSFAPAI